MKNILHFLFLVGALYVNAQPPQVINYQGVARDSIGHPLLNQNVGIRLSILDSSSTGQSVYVETHQALTNNSGLFNLSIGGGVIVNGSFSAVNWGQNNKWLKIEMDASGGANYQSLGTMQFLSVPYALHAGTANSANIISPNPASASFTMFSLRAPQNMFFYMAMNYCYNLIEAGYSDWRLPSIDEFNKYVELNGLPISSVSFPDGSYSWTTTRSLSSSGYESNLVLIYDNGSGFNSQFINQNTGAVGAICVR